MNLTLVVATPDRQVATHFSVKKAGALPADSLKRGFFADKKVSVSVFSYWSDAPNAPKLDEYLKHLMRDTDGLILLCDDRISHICSRFSDALFIATYSSNLGGRTVQNYFGYFFAKVLRNFSTYAIQFNMGHLQKFLLLPLRNFSAPELSELRKIFSSGSTAIEFGDAISRQLALLNKRRTPKTSSNYDTVYIRDDRDHYYIYGLEKHSRAETSIPPHSTLCALNGLFRFGLKYDLERHFNVSARKDREYISGDFLDCHDARQAVKDRTHLNMFPNDYF